MSIRRKAAVICIASAGLSAALAIVALLTGGFRVHVAGIPISARGEHRAALFALVLGVAGFVALDEGGGIRRRALKKIASGGTAAAARIAANSRTLCHAIAVAAALAVLVAGVRLGVRSAGGSDPSGYVSAAKLWRAGQVRLVTAHARGAPWPNAGGTFTPLAYSPVADGMVPIVSPGLPLLMAGAEVAAGPCAVFLVGPVCAALLVWLTFLLGARTFDAVVGLSAALCIAASPPMLFMSMSVMSDVPAAAFWTAALLLSAGRSRASVVAGGAAAGIAIAIRANLAPLAVFPMLLAASTNGSRPGTAQVRALLFAAGCAPFIIGIAVIFDMMYGSPFRSGYGSASNLFSLRNFVPNLDRYPRWLLETHGIVPFMFVGALAVAPRSMRTRVLLLTTFVGATFGCYVFYDPFDAWWFLRFLLPAFPPMFLLAFFAIRESARRFGELAKAIALTMLLAAALYQGLSRTIEYGITHLAYGEQKYADAARYANAHLPPNAIVMSMQHSGSVRLYSGRPILRYDLLGPDWFDRAIEFVRGRGLEPFFLGEEWEAEIVRERFIAQRNVAVFSGQPIAELPEHKLRIYRLDGVVSAERPAIIPSTAGCRDD